MLLLAVALLATQGFAAEPASSAGNAACPQNLDVPNIEDPTSVTPPTPVAAPAPAGPASSGARIPPRFGSAADSGTPLSDPGNTIVSTALDSENLAATAQGAETVSAAARASRNAAQAAAEDQRTLSEAYRRMSPQEIGESMDRAYQSLIESSQLLSELPYFRNLALNARDKAALAIESLRRRAPSASAFDQAFGSSGQQHDPQTDEGLVDRIVMLNGLKDPDKEKTFQKLKLSKEVELKAGKGGTKKVALLHNGPNGHQGSAAADQGSIECSEFVSSLLPAASRKTGFNSLDLRAMWIYRRTGSLPDPPNYLPSRASAVKKAADAFFPVDVYGGAGLRPGDLLVHRLPSDADGRVLLIKSYNPATRRAEVLESSPETGVLHEREFSLSSSNIGDPARELRPGLAALRLKPVSNAACRYGDSRQGGAK